MNEGQEKSPFSESLAAEENGLGFENLNQRLQRYAGAKSRALDMADYIKTEEVSNNENRKLVKKLGDCASYLVFKHYYTENKVILHGMKTCRQQLLCPFCALRRAAKHVSLLGQGGHCESRKPRFAVVFCDVDGKGRRKPTRAV